MATEDVNYRLSSQYRLWSFSPPQLADLRHKTNALAKQSITERLSSSTLSSPSASASSTSAPASGANTPRPGAENNNNSNTNTKTDHVSALPEFLTPAEEQQLLDFYIIELLRAARFIELPTEIQATAAVFLRRFYVTNSIMTYPPMDMLKTALFFGSKAEGSYLRLSWFVEKLPNTKGAQILAGEFLLCQGIRFSFDVRHPFRALEGAVMELRRFGDISDNRIALAHKRSRDILKFSPLLTDAYFHYTPSQIMLAALSSADRGLMERLVTEGFRPRRSNPSSSRPAASSGSGKTKIKIKVKKEEDGEADAAPATSTEENGVKVKKEEESGGGGGGDGAGAGDSPDDNDNDNDEIIGAAIKEKVLATIESCREMLAAEPPERLDEYWGQPEADNILRPLRKKLRKCRDPDRWDLVALQQAKKEAPQKKAAAGSRPPAPLTSSQSKNGGSGNKPTSALEASLIASSLSMAEDAAVFGEALAAPAAGGGAENRDAKRRKVADAALGP